MLTGGSPADVTITFFGFLAVFLLKVVGIWGTGGGIIASNHEIEGPDSWEEWDTLLDSKIWSANEMASGAMVGGAGNLRWSSKDIVFRVSIVGVTFILSSRPLSFWRVFGPTFLDAPVYVLAVLGVATVEYVTLFRFIDTMVVVLGAALDCCKAITRPTAEAAKEKGVGVGSCSAKWALPFPLDLDLDFFFEEDAYPSHWALGALE